MGKLNIAHHKSYHPYRLDNIERVRRDEEEARLKEQSEESRMMLADSEARIQLLRERSGTSKSRRKEEEKKERELLDQATAPRPSGSGTTVQGHINLFEDLEQNETAVAAAFTSKSIKGKGKAEETEKGVPLAPSAKDLNPWYSSSRKDDPNKDMDDDKRNKDASLKSRHDPLTSINQRLRSRPHHSSHNSKPHPSRYQHTVTANSSSMLPPTSASTASDSALSARLTRESSERQRALELKRRKQLELEGSMTPSSVQNSAGYKYGDQFNRREVEEAHRWREKDRGLERGRKRRDVRDRSW